MYCRAAGSFPFPLPFPVVTGVTGGDGCIDRWDKCCWFGGQPVGILLRRVLVCVCLCVYREFVQGEGETTIRKLTGQEIYFGSVSGYYKKLDSTKSGLTLSGSEVSW